MDTWNDRSSSALFTGALVFTLVFTLACGGSSPTAPGAPPAPGSGVTISIQSSALAGSEGVIRRELEDTFAQVARQLPIDGLTISVDSGPLHLISGWGVGGFSPASGRRVEIAVDPGLAEAALVARLPSMAAHEFHHVARHRGQGYGNTLLQAMVSEGLADHYAAELLGQPLPPWAVALSEAQIDQWIERARPELDSRRYDHEAWFFGAGAGIPRWAGYAIGFKLVGDYMAAHPGTTAASLVNTDSGAFRPAG